MVIQLENNITREQEETIVARIKETGYSSRIIKT